ncbi:MAG TPA: hypothetical protein VHR84_13735 [Terriglobales bacterium]|jgi:hypothetical protein|nr:hypothetical protein [Terriglobales bacterium]
MTLLEAVQSLDSLDIDSTIYAAEPWTPNSDVVLLRETDAGVVTSQDLAEGITYFLEVFIAREVLEDWVPQNVPTLLEQVHQVDPVRHI